MNSEKNILEHCSLLNHFIDLASFYFPVDHILKEIHKSNMRKLGGGFDEGGKIKKPEGWEPPDIAGVLRKHGF